MVVGWDGVGWGGVVGRGGVGWRGRWWVEVKVTSGVVWWYDGVVR